MHPSLELQVVAEGVENPAQLELLKQRHCEEGQGYLFSRPVGGDDFYGAAPNPCASHPDPSYH